jgi:predicted transcriptional regulator
MLISPKENAEDAAKLQDELKRFKVPVEIIPLKGDIMEEMFEILADIKRIEGEDNVLVNVATGDRMSTCAALSASYVNGLRAFAVMNNEPMLLPMLRFTYSNILSDRKVLLLRILSEGPRSFAELAHQAKVSPPLLSYHLNGDKDSSGLIQLGLVEDTDEKGRRLVHLSSMGKLFVRGYL